MSATVENQKARETYIKEFFGKPVKLPGKNAPVMINYLTTTWNTAPMFAKKFGCKTDEFCLLASWIPSNITGTAELKELPKEFMGIKVFYKKGHRIKVG